MMRLPITILLMIAAAVGSAPAQERATVRSVEHPEYSRLVVPIPAGVTWQVVMDGSRARLRLIGATPDYDLSGVFDRMPRTRILSATAEALPEGQQITLSLACSCDVVPQTIGSNYLAVDVRRAGQAEATSPGLRQRFLRPPPTPVASPDAPAGAGDEPVPAGAPETPSPNADAGRDASPAASADGTLPDADAGGAKSSDMDPVLVARAELMRQLARAAEAGMLTIAPAAEDSVLPPPTPAAQEERPDAVPALHPAPARPDADATGLPEPRAAADLLASQLTYRGPNDPRRRAPDAQANVGPAGSICVADAALDVAGWSAADADFANALGPKRSGLISGTGEIDPSAVADLARFYIGAGFGREVHALLGVMGEAVPDRALLLDLATVVEGKSPMPEGPVGASEGCVGRISLWRAASGFTDITAEASAPAVREALAELPPRLRRLVGRSLIHRALTAGSPERAREIIDLLDRTPGMMTSAERVARARTSIAEGNPDAALQFTAPLIERTVAGPDALLAHADAVLAAGAIPSRDLLTAFDTALATQRVESAIGFDLRLARIRLAATVDGPVTALAALRRLPAPNPARQAEISALARSLLAGYSDEERGGTAGARAILENLSLLGSDAESQALRIEYAEALMAGGLPNSAIDILADAGALTGPHARMIRAKATLALGRPLAALSALEGLSTPEAAVLRADAHLRRGDLTAGYRALRAAEVKPAARDRLALLSRSWQEIGPESGGGEFAALRAYAEREATGRTPPDTPVPTLRAAAAALEQAAALRSVVSDLPEIPSN